MIKIKILRSFFHCYGHKRVFLRSGGNYFLDEDKKEDKDELLYMKSNSFPYKDSIDFGIKSGYVIEL